MLYNIAQLHREFLEHLEIEKGRSLKTIENYDHHLARFFDWLMGYFKKNTDKISAEEISEEAKKQGHQRFGIAGYDKGQWILLDFVTVVVHIFDEERRDYYNLEMLWGDGKKLIIDE